MLVLLGTITRVGGEPALVTSGQAREYPEDATLPLRWIRDRLSAARAEQLVAVVSARSDGTFTVTNERNGFSKTYRRSR